MYNFIKISDAASIALHTMVYIASRKKKQSTTKEIADAFKVSEAHLSKVLQRLKKAGFVETERGPKGGYKIIREIDEISLMDIYKAIEGEFSPTNCLLSKKAEDAKCCLLGDVVKDLNIMVINYLTETHLSKLIHICESMNKEELVS